MEKIILSLLVILIAAALCILFRHGLQARKTPLPSRRGTPAPAEKPKEFHLAGPRESSPSADIFHLQLEILRQTLDLTTVALFWAGRQEEKLHLLSVTSLRDDIRADPFVRGTGIIGALRNDRRELAVCPVSQHRATIPYYPSNREVGAFFALRLPLAHGAPSSAESPLAAMAVLCLDREEAAPWSEREQEIIRLGAQKLTQDLLLDRKMAETSRDKEAIHQICLGLQELNEVLDLKAVFAATITAIRRLFAADFVVISLLEDGEHTIVKAAGPMAAELEGLRFPAADGLVGQAIKLRRWMPPHDNYQGAAPIFSRELWTNDFQSLIILPLLKEGNQAIGALTVAAEKTGLFNPQRRQILEIIAGQVTTKIQLALAHEKICQLATIDGLTGLKNHRTFQHAFDNMLKRAERMATPLSLVLCDLDHFKRINDTHGHPFGDQVLQAVAATLGASIRSVDLAARYGGEEFALLLEDSDIEGARNQTERVRQAIRDLHFTAPDETVTISMSFGLASFPGDGETKNELIRRADQALYRAKEGGRDRVVAWADA